MMNSSFFILLCPVLKIPTADIKRTCVTKNATMNDVSYADFACHDIINDVKIIF